MSLAHAVGYEGSAPPRDHRGTAAAHAEAAEVADRLEAATIAARAPLTLPVLEDHDDRPRDLSQAFAGRPVLLAFYLGGWSEPCTGALRQLDLRRADLDRRGVAVVAVTADAVGRIGKTRDKHRLGVLAVHDHGARFAQSLGLGYRVSAKVRSELRSAGVKLSDWTGGTGHQLTLPATLLLGADRSIRPFLTCGPNGVRSDVQQAIEAALAGGSALP